MEYNHEPVLLNECIEGLDIKPDGCYVDCTVGGGGHSLEILRRLGSGGRLIAFDKDQDALTVSQVRLQDYSKKVEFINDDFKNSIEHLDGLSIERIDGVLIDLGVSSFQIDNNARGFSYINDGPLDMRMDKTQLFTAFDLVNEYPENKLSKIFFDYGEERYSKSIAAAIVKYRVDNEITTTGCLQEIIKKSVPPKYRYGEGNPCKRVFQAIRIEVNGELKGLEDIIIALAGRLAKKGRIAVISFHSLEDRIVKKAFNYLSSECICPKEFPVCRCQKKKTLKILTKKPVIAGEAEIKRNSRSECAKLRIGMAESL